MLRCFRLVLFATIISSFYTYAQHIDTMEHTRGKTIKVENSLIISWEVYSTDANENQVDIFDQEGRPVTSLNVLRPVQEAERVGVYDVSARLGSMIAVAAVYGSKAGSRYVRPVPSLLLFDLNGRLVSAFSLAPSREISRLAVDDKSNVWTLTAHADHKDPTTIPLLVEYTAQGTVARELLTRSMFPLHASVTNEDPSIGRASIGYDSGILWFWLPGSTDLVTVSADDGKPKILKTQMPKRVGRNSAVPFNVVRESSGNIVAQVHEDGEHGGSTEITNYTWSVATGTWLRFNPGACDGGRFIGIGDKGLIYLMYKTDPPDAAHICVFSAQ